MASAFQKVRATTNAMVGLFERFDVLAMPAFGEHCAHCFAAYLPTPLAQLFEELSCTSSTRSIKPAPPSRCAVLALQLFALKNDCLLTLFANLCATLCEHG